MSTTVTAHETVHAVGFAACSCGWSWSADADQETARLTAEAHRTRPTGTCRRTYPHREHVVGSMTCSGIDSLIGA